MRMKPLHKELYKFLKTISKEEVKTNEKLREKIIGLESYLLKDRPKKERQNPTLSYLHKQALLRP